MDEPHLYRAMVRWAEGKRGTLRAAELTPVPVATPAEFGGPGDAWSPEDLFLGAIASCFLTTFVAIAGNSRLEFADLDVEAEGSVSRGEDRRYRIPEVTLRAKVRLRREEDRERALRILDKAHQACLITNSVRSDVRLDAAAEAPA